MNFIKAIIDRVIGARFATPWLIFAAAAVLLPRPAGAELLLSQSFHSDALGAEMKYSIYLPPGLDPDGSYPVIYLLHGIGGDELSWPKLGNVEKVADDLISAKKIAPVVLVMPAVGNSWYLDTASFGGPGNYATAVQRDLRGHVEATYPVAANPRDRAIIGLSMGGFGSLRLGFSEASQYAAIGSYSPTLFWQYGHIARVTGGEAAELHMEFGVRAPKHFFRDHDPFAYLVGYLNSDPAPRVFLAAGDDDQLDTARYVLEMQRILTNTGHHPEWRIYNGGHEWSVWRQAFEDNLELLGQSIWPAATK